MIGHQDPSRIDHVSALLPSLSAVSLELMSFLYVCLTRNASEVYHKSKIVRAVKESYAQAYRSILLQLASTPELCYLAGQTVVACDR